MVGFCGTDHKACFMPVDVLSTEVDHLTGSSSQAGKQHQDGSIAQIDGRLASREYENPLHLLSGQAFRYRIMGPLTGGKGNGFQARRECPTEDEKSQEGSHGGTRKFSATPMFVGRFLLHKI